MLLTAEIYEKLYSIVFQDDYPGYRPNVIEAPNGNNVWDTEKKYAHVARKYLDQIPDSSDKKYLLDILLMALGEAQKIATALKLPPQFWPTYEDSTIRVLFYPPGAVTNPHYDFDLFTTMLYRDQKPCFKYIGEEPDLPIQALSNQIHYGEIIELVDPKFKATYHEVKPSETPQKSIVFFAMPPLDAVLPNGQIVKDWLAERMSRSRKEV